MSNETVNQLIERLVQSGPLTVERFSSALGAPLKAGEVNPFWQTYTFELAGGPFASGEVRLNTPGTGALLILEPRDPSSIAQADVDRVALGPRVGVRPNPHIPPEGIITEFYERNGVQVAPQWRATSRQLHSLVLTWEAPKPEAAPSAAGAASAN
jgi:hypothetical protein